MPRLGVFAEWSFMQLLVEAVHSEGTILRWLLYEFPLCCQNGIITKRQYMGLML